MRFSTKSAEDTENSLSAIIGRRLLSPQKKTARTLWLAHAITNQGRTDPPFPAA